MMLLALTSSPSFLEFSLYSVWRCEQIREISWSIQGTCSHLSLPVSFASAPALATWSRSRLQATPKVNDALRVWVDAEFYPFARETFRLWILNFFVFGSNTYSVWDVPPQSFSFRFLSDYIYSPDSLINSTRSLSFPTAHSSPRRTSCCILLGNPHLSVLDSDCSTVCPHQVRTSSCVLPSSSPFSLCFGVALHIRHLPAPPKCELNDVSVLFSLVNTTTNNSEFYSCAINHKKEARKRKWRIQMVKTEREESSRVLSMSNFDSIFCTPLFHDSHK